MTHWTGSAGLPSAVDGSDRERESSIPIKRTGTAPGWFAGLLRDCVFAAVSIGCGMAAVLVLDSLRYATGWRTVVIGIAGVIWFALAFVGLAACITGGRAERRQR